jgi:hypothetical protein
MMQNPLDGEPLLFARPSWLLRAIGRMATHADHGASRCQEYLAVLKVL